MLILYWNVSRSLQIIELYPHLFTFLSIHFAVHNEKASMRLRDDDTSSSYNKVYIDIWWGLAVTVYAISSNRRGKLT